ncbi:MAG TPA: acetylornithine deacetylase [Pyrinomonadaceae bacterium]|nr:acetylornithine deacetylase [Pyrinomonadaceae bacterium]
MSLKQTLTELVAINSVSSLSNAPIIDYLDQRCASLGFVTSRFSYIDEKGLDKINLVAVVGTELSDVTNVELALVGHTDTVPFDPHWEEALTLTERDDRLFARGSCDTKGFIAAMLSAVARIDLKNLRRPLAMVFTSDEEIGLRGAKFLADLNVLRPRYSIVGEPTSLQPIRAGKGYSLSEIVVSGREAHSAYPALGASAVFRAARLINRLERIAERLRQDQHSEFDPPYTTVNVGLLRGGTAKNVIAGECRFTVEWRPIPSQASDHVFELLNQAIAEEQKTDVDFAAELKLERLDSGFETAKDSRIVSLLERLTEKRAGTVAFGTEAAQMTVLGSEAVVFGPGDIREAHRTGEFVPVNELERSSEILQQAVLDLCG